MFQMLLKHLLVFFKMRSSNSMKIGIVIKEFTLKKGGVERYAVNISKILADQGYDVNIFTSFYEGIPDKKMKCHKVPLLRNPSILKIVSFPLFCRWIMKKKVLDITYALTPLYPVDIYRIGEGLHIDVLRYRYNSGKIKLSKLLNPKHLAILYLEKQIFRRNNFRKIVCNSNILKERTVYNYGVSPDDISVIYNGINTEIFNPDAQRYRLPIRRSMGISDEEFVILFVSNDFYRKGLSRAIDAIYDFSKHFRKRWRFVVAGRDNPFRYIKRAREYGIDRHIIFTGMRTDIERLYGMSDVLLLPTLYDPFANVVLESIACGTPVITTRINGASEIIEDGKTGFVIDGRKDEIVSALMNVSDGGLLELMRKKCKEESRNFTIERHVETLLKLFSEVIESRTKVS